MFQRDTQLCDDILLWYFSISNDHVMDLVNGFLFGDGDWFFAKFDFFELRSPLLDNVERSNYRYHVSCRHS